MVERDILRWNIVCQHVDDFCHVLKTLVNKKSLVLSIQIESCLLISFRPCQVNACECAIKKTVFVIYIHCLDLEDQMRTT